MELDGDNGKYSGNYYIIIIGQYKVYNGVILGRMDKTTETTVMSYTEVDLSQN